MDHSKPPKLNNRYAVDMSALGLALIIVLSFLLHLFTRMFSGYAYAILLAAFTMICVVSNRKTVIRGNWLTQAWFFAAAMIVFSFLHSQRSNGALLDIIVFTCGLLLIVFNSGDENEYLRCLPVIKVLAIFFAAGVLLQVFVPPLYRLIIAFFPSAYRTALVSGERSGFTLNTGYSAGYIIAGLIAMLSGTAGAKRLSPKDAIMPLLLLAALVLTGKRGPTVFLVATVILCYLAPVSGSRKFKRYWKLFLLGVAGLLFLWMFRDALASIPIIGRTFDSIKAYGEGEDVTSGRSRLYVWALELFRKNPLFGIGWGRFRTTVVGNVTVAKELETHDIYLQLLAETGITGFIVFVSTFLLFWNTTRIAYCDCVRKNDPDTTGWRQLLLFSFAYQTYFLFYGLTGNPLYDPHFQIMYLFSCLIIAAYTTLKDPLYKR